MLISMSLLFLVTLLSTLLTLAIFMMTKSNSYKEKASPYECGFDPFCQPRIPFSLRFFLIAILFLIFDVELTLVLPFPFSIFLQISSWVPLSTFILILALGLLYEWKMGSLEWAK